MFISANLKRSELFAFFSNDILSSLDRIPKALSDKALTDIKTKQAAAAKQAQNKGIKSSLS